MKSVTRVIKNPHGPARFTGNRFKWICETPDGNVLCYTRDDARDVAARYNQERRALIKEFEKTQAKANFYDGRV